MASVRKRKWTHNGVEKESWIVAYTDQAGKRRIKSFEKKKDADKERVRIESELSRGEHVAESATMTVKSICDDFLRRLDARVRDGGLSVSRRRFCFQAIQYYIVPTIGNRLLSRLTWNDVDQVWQAMTDKGLAPVTKRQYMQVFKMVEDYARQKECILKEVVGLYKTPSVPFRKIRTFNAEQIRLILDTASKSIRGQSLRSRNRMLLFINLAAFTGLRLGEIMGLTINAINFEKSVIHVRHSLNDSDVLKGPKTRSGLRDVPMPAYIADMLRIWIGKYYYPNERELLFRYKTGGMIRRIHIRDRYWLPLLARAGLAEQGDQFHFHALRHFAASWMIHNGLTVPDVAALLGHRSFDMTLQVYAHPIMEGRSNHHLFERMHSSLMSIPSAAPLPNATRERQDAVNR